jgi:hypothetical protein
MHEVWMEGVDQMLKREHAEMPVVRLMAYRLTLKKDFGLFTGESAA